MRIVVASDHLPPHRSGHAVAAAWWIRVLAEAGHEVMVVADAPPLDGAEVAWRRLPVLPGFTPGHPLAALRPAVTALADLAPLRPDVVHLHGYGPACRSVQRALPGVPTVVTLHQVPEGSGTPLPWLVRPVMTAMLNRALRSADGVTVPSERTRRDVEAIAGPEVSRPRVVPTGVDPVFEQSSGRRPRTPAQPERAHFLYVGRRTPDKGYRLFERLAGMHPEADWIAIGSGPEPDARSPVQVRTGATAEGVRAAMLEADAVLAPGPHETQGLVVLEALHCGTAVAVPRGGAQAEPVADGVHGALFEMGDTDGAWEALQRARDLTRRGKVRPPDGYARAALVERMAAALTAASERAIRGRA